ncbi:MAG: glutaredoxin family protein [Actinomycetota bacterium]|nr:glutaredoxin family protein [Actinomycetota bacterium]
MAEPITMYSTTWCGHCRRLTRQLDEAGIAYRVVDLDDHPQFGARIVAATGGYRTVPTLEIGDDLLVNPSLPQVQATLRG